MALAERKDDFIVVKTEYRDKDLIRAVPGARYDVEEHVWRVPLSWAGCLTLHGLFRERLELGPELYAWWNDFRESFVVPSLEMRTATDAEGDADLYPFQRAGVRWMTHVRTGILTDEMGTGKTVQTIRTLVSSLREVRLNPFPALVVAPNNMKATWRKEFATWWPGVEVAMLDGGRAERLREIERVRSGEAHVLVANWEALRHHSRLAPYGSIRLKRCVKCDPTLRDEVAVAEKNVEQLQAAFDDLPEGMPDDDPDRALARTSLDEAIAAHKKAARTHSPNSCERCARELNTITWTTVVADEAHKMKDPKAKQTRALWACRTDDTKLRYALTGTPIAESPDDLWCSLHLIDPKAFPVRTKYVDRWCLTTFNPFGGMTIIGLKPETRQEFFHITDPYVRRMPKSVVLSQLPPKVYTTRYVEMSPKQAKAYKSMRDDMISELDDVGYGDRLVAVNPLTQLTRLSQFASSFGHLEEVFVRDPQTGLQVPKLEVRLSEPSNKLDAMVELNEELNGKPAGVFAQSRQLIELLAARFTKLRVPHVTIVGGQSAAERQVNIERFQRGEVSFVLATVGAGGVGITLTRGDTCVFMQRSWSMIENAQAEDRFHRIGSEIHESINVIDLVSPGTIEEGQRHALAAKNDRMQEVVRDDELLRLIRGEM